MLSAGRPCLSCQPLAGLRWHAMHGQTFVGMPVFQQTLAVRLMIGIAWLPCYFLAELGCFAVDWQSLVAMPYSAKLCLTSSLPTICNISHYLHYSQLFATTLPNYSQLFALFPTIHKYGGMEPVRRYCWVAGVWIPRFFAPKL